MQEIATTAQLTPDVVQRAAWYWYTFYGQMRAEIRVNGMLCYLSCPLTGGVVSVWDARTDEPLCAPAIHVRDWRQLGIIPEPGQTLESSEYVYRLYDAVGVGS